MEWTPRIPEDQNTPREDVDTFPQFIPLLVLILYVCICAGFLLYPSLVSP